MVTNVPLTFCQAQLQLQFNYNFNLSWVQLQIQLQFQLQLLAKLELGTAQPQLVIFYLLTFHKSSLEDIFVNTKLLKQCRLLLRWHQPCLTICLVTFQNNNSMREPSPPKWLLWVHFWGFQNMNPLAPKLLVLEPKQIVTTPTTTQRNTTSTL